jgi:Rrf2 family protein
LKISTKGRYALEAVVDLALNSSDGHESLKNIAERRGFSENYLEQIFVLLRKSNIVESIRGAQGGYRLTRDASEITAGDIIRAAEGDMAVVPCISSKVNKEEKPCDMVDCCVTRGLWGKITQRINEIADSVTIEDLMNCYREKQTEPIIDYYI